MTIAVASVSRILEKTKKDAFLASAYAFIEAVRHRVALGEVVLPYKLDDWEEVYLDKTMLEKGTKSPYGNSYKLIDDPFVPDEEIDELNQDITTARSHITIHCKRMKNDECELEYYIFLSDGKMSIGCYSTNTSSGWGYFVPNLNSNLVRKLDYCTGDEEW